MNTHSTLLDADRDDAIRMTPDEAHALGMGALKRLGYSDENAKIIVDQLIDNALCGYRFASLPRILAIAGDDKLHRTQKPVTIVHETPLSALLDGGNNVGYISCYKGAQVAIEKASKSGIACVGIYDSYYSGRNAYFAEMVTKAGLICIHVASAKARVLPIGGTKPALGTNPFCVGFPSSNGPVIIDIGTASLMWGDVMLHAHLGQELPEGIGFDADGNPTTDAKKVIQGGVIPFGGHKGYALSIAVQALGLLAGAAIPQNKVQDYGFLFIAIDPKIMLPGGQYPEQMAELIEAIKATPKRNGVDEIRIPSERAFKEREIRRTQGLVYDKEVVASLKAL
jgi:hypothetical protein